MCVSCKGGPLASLSLSEPGRDSWGESTLHILVSVSHPPLRYFLLSPFPLEGKGDTVRKTPFFSRRAHHPVLPQEADGAHSVSISSPTAGPPSEPISSQSACRCWASAVAGFTHFTLHPLAAPQLTPVSPSQEIPWHVSLPSSLPSDPVYSDRRVSATKNRIHEPPRMNLHAGAENFSQYVGSGARTTLASTSAG